MSRLAIQPSTESSWQHHIPCCFCSRQCTPPAAAQQRQAVDVPVAASCTMQVCTASTAWVLLKHRLMRANVSPAIAANNCGSTGSGSRVCAAMPQPQLADFVHQPAQTTLLLFRLLQVKRMMQAISQNTSYCPE